MILVFVLQKKEIDTCNQLSYYFQIDNNSDHIAYCSEVPITRPPMVLVESGLNREQVSQNLRDTFTLKKCILLLKQVVRIIRVVLISIILIGRNLLRFSLYSGTICKNALRDEIYVP